MVDKAVLRAVRRYLRVLREHGIPAKYGVIYGSHARGTARPESDIDLLVVSPAFDPPRRRGGTLLWRLTLKVDLRIEPIPVGEKQFREDGVFPLLEVARREGVKVRAPAPPGRERAEKKKGRRAAAGAAQGRGRGGSRGGRSA